MNAYYLYTNTFYLIYLYFKERMLILAGHASVCLLSQYFGGGDKPISMGFRPSRAPQCDHCLRNREREEGQYH